MGKGNFTDEFKLKAITERGYSVADVSKRLGMHARGCWLLDRAFSFHENRWAHRSANGCQAVRAVGLPCQRPKSAPASIN